MQLSGIVSPVHTAFTAASAKYQSAVDYLQSPLELPFPILAGQALEQVSQAVELLAPHTASSDMFAQRSATGSIAAAKDAVEMIGQLIDPAADSAVTVDAGVAKLRSADSILWQE